MLWDYSVSPASHVLARLDPVLTCNLGKWRSSSFTNILAVVTVAACNGHYKTAQSQAFDKVARLQTFRCTSPYTTSCANSQTGQNRAVKYRAVKMDVQLYVYDLSQVCHRCSAAMAHTCCLCDCDLEADMNRVLHVACHDSSSESR